MTSFWPKAPDLIRTQHVLGKTRAKAADFLIVQILLVVHHWFDGLIVTYHTCQSFSSTHGPCPGLIFEGWVHFTNEPTSTAEGEQHLATKRT